ncbi:uncharacterized protein SPPG_02697 [Spizellomyces punctatus DAOM BR117]|uniref:Uncharacterized protein n=1 Tax=Spizellomyces punctatus (strain DAOM BR117) TaxID=645134 RepID=A0A0L0HM92_SPIPD|nr:uncharacterized protein SPPG_02697 [Spizellomyces punctatus DAOM BR117]KND02212.1 hypothetical protein SPPG_02697 [Spizellomyces punctatus DAOM BR117]|eukprot:XP_016610251.1 hypothetical protein SPPG_02697 [Spizellomyces punctatus DAOM BR117]
MPNTDIDLPPCIYSSTKPYNGFTTLLHRFGRYERIRSMSSLAPRTVEPVSFAEPSQKSLERNAAMEAFSMQMARPEMEDQRVALTPKQEIKLELARLKAAVEKLKSGEIQQVQDTQQPQPQPQSQQEQSQQLPTLPPKPPKPTPLPRLNQKPSMANLFNFKKDR